ncbi:AI-2E family transporter [Sphingomonas nostoxanthinifaciens]|uniref:AI-2E family transporter n=1 Tax=Sphingomonas nostoxanthinifaciens TaxID=2872652 RepID=UPI001CC21F7B|nr:AI-2E family transporter [Sphingomonas nostoxanthinifaciens]UAK24734.1 AI-2E family transporter [Sphingomonas nostoxanthinifaciens]
MSDSLRAPEEPGPSDFANPLTSREVQRASVWIGMVVAVALIWMLTQPLLLIIGGIVFAALLDGGVRLLGKILPAPRGIRLAIVAVLVVLFVMGFMYLAGSQLAGQAQALRAVVESQVTRIMGYGHQYGLIPADQNAADLGKQLVGSVGKVTAWVGSALGALSSLAMIVVIGLFVAIEPRLYERGIAWMLPMDKRADFYRTSDKMGHTLRRLMAGRLVGMGVEGLFVGVALSIIGVPMAPLLGVLTGLLAFLPNIGSIVSGALIVLVGFSAGTNIGIGAIIVYVAVQTFDGYVVVPMVARRAVDLAPALVLGCQLLLGALFGILGLALADPIVCMIKVLLEEKSELAAEAEAEA